MGSDYAVAPLPENDPPAFLNGRTDRLPADERNHGRGDDARSAVYGPMDAMSTMMEVMARYVLLGGF